MATGEERSEPRWSPTHSVRSARSAQPRIVHTFADTALAGLVVQTDDSVTVAATSNPVSRSAMVATGAVAAPAINPAFRCDRTVAAVQPFPCWPHTSNELGE